jgi:hypothetical protein
MKRTYYETPTPSRLMRFFWKSAGGDRYLLERSTYADQIKYMCLGGIIVATGIMAALAGGYAFYTIFAPRGSAIDSEVSWGIVALSAAFGFFWGLMIFNLDRFIVSSTGTGDGTEAITRQEFSSAVPRIILGAIIAITISKPVEIRMFQTEINVALHEAQMEKKRDYLAKIDARFAARIQEEKMKIENWKTEIEAKENRSVILEDEYIEEARNIRPGPKARAVKEQWERSKVEENQIKNKYDPLIAEAYDQIGIYEQEKKDEIGDGAKVAAGLDGLLERMKLAHKIAGWEITLFVTLLFMAIELTPIFFKLMLIKSPYDYMKENVNEQIIAEEGILIKRNYHRDRRGQERDLVKFMGKSKIEIEQERLLDMQEELTEYALQQYKASIMKLIDEDPEKFIQSKKSDDA